MPFFIDFSTKIEIFPHFSSISGIFLYVAVVSDNDGSAFITKAEFDSLKNNFQAQIDNYNQSIDSKIDGAIAAYLAGIKISTSDERLIVDWVRDYPDNVSGYLGGKYTELFNYGHWGGTMALGLPWFEGHKNGLGAGIIDQLWCSSSSGSWSSNYKELTQVNIYDLNTDGLITPVGISLRSDSITGNNIPRTCQSHAGGFYCTHVNQWGTGSDAFVWLPGSWEEDQLFCNAVSAYQVNFYMQAWPTSVAPVAQLRWANYEHPMAAGETVYQPLVHVKENSGTMDFKWYHSRSDLCAEWKPKNTNTWFDEYDCAVSESVFKRSDACVWLTLRHNDGWVDLTPKTGNIFKDYTYSDDIWKSTGEFEANGGDILYIAFCGDLNSSRRYCTCAKFLMKYTVISP